MLRRRFEAAWGRSGVRPYIPVLRLLEKCFLAELTAAVDQALAFGVTTADGVRVVLEHGREAPCRCSGTTADRTWRGWRSPRRTWPPTAP